MLFLDKKIGELSYKYLSDYTKEIAIEEYHSNEEFLSFIEFLINDKRKNVSSLGSKFQKKVQNYHKEIERVQSMYNFDKAFGEYRYVAGVDEVGRGPLAGPIVSCAVVLDLNVLPQELLLEIKDSKLLSVEKRERLAEIIKEKAISYSIALCSHEEIDEIGIGVCNNKIFLEACAGLKVKPDFVLSDGYSVRGIKIKNEAIIKGDTKSASIACASIIAKVFRDNLMYEYSGKYPNYGFNENAGYGTPKHVEAIKIYGPCKIHRKSFLKNILNSNL